MNPASNLIRAACAIGCAVLVVASVLLSNLGFGKIQDFRMLERIPLSTITAAIPGEVQFKGQTRAIETIKAPRTGTPSIYYRYLVEREERDSEGNRRWRTIQDEVRAVDFNLQDNSGSALIRLARAGNTDINVKQRHRDQQGKLRYTEWRLEQGDTVTLYGWLENSRAAVNFNEPGRYLPILSAMGSAAERTSIGNSALLFLWGGITSLVLACLAFTIVLQVHRTLLFLSLVSAATFLLLFNLGYQSVKSDVASGYEQVAAYLARSESRDADEVTQHADNERAALRYLMTERYNRQTENFPESWVKRTAGFAPFPVIDLTEAQQAIALSKAGQFTYTQASQSYVLLPIGFILSAVFAWFAFRIIKVKRIQENLPTSKTAGVTYGLAEVVGNLDNEADRDLFTGPVSGVLCCWYRELVKEKRGSGKNAKWITIKDEIRKQPLVIKDEEGEIRAFPGQADIVTKHKTSRRSGNRRYTEWRLSPGDELYVLGKARLDKTRGDSLVFGHEKGSPYIIANVPEAQVMLQKAVKGMGLLSVGISLLFLAVIWLGGSGGSFSSVDFLIAAAIAPMFLIFVMFVLMYNDLVFLKERCERNWANIQISLKKRADLIPRLESVVKEYLDHEANLQQGLALLRERAGKIDTESDMDRYMAAEHVSIAELSARIEQYPDLKGTELMQDFHRRLVKLENEVALIRAGFNDAITQYRTRTQTFPDNILARWFNFKPREMLSYAEKAHPIPEIKLD